MSEIGCYDLRLTCDYCGAEGEFADGIYQSRTDAMKAARKDGWTRDKLKLDACYICAARNALKKLGKKTGN